MKDKKIFDLVSKYRTELMGISAIWIFLYHKWEPVFQDVIILNKIESFVINNGGVGVDVFLFLSGMGLVFSYDKSSSIYDFYYKRIKRLLFPSFIKYIITLGLSIECIKELIAYNYLFDNMVIGRIAWFINAITILYFVFPIYYELFKRTNKYIFSACIILIVYLLNYHFAEYIRPDIFSLINRLPIFIIGILFGWYGKHKNNITYSKPMVIVLLFALLLYGKINLKMKYYDYNNAILLTLCLVFLLPLVFDFLKSHYINNAFSFLGICSLEIYIVQFSINPSRFYDNFPVFIANILLMITTVFFSWMLRKINDYVWIIIEKIINLNKK